MSVNRMSHCEAAGSAERAASRLVTADLHGHPDIVMIIECPVCGTRFRFAKTLFKARGGAAVRCRRCGGSIEVRNPDFPPLQVAPGPSPALEDPAAVTERGGGDSVAPEAARPDDSDDPSRPLSAFPRQVANARGEIFESAAAGRRSPGRGRRTIVPLPWLGGALSFLLGFVAVLLYLQWPGGERTPARSAVWRPAASAELPGPGGEYEFDRVETFYQMNHREGRVFVLKGRVSNKSSRAGHGAIQVRVLVRSAAKGIVAVKTVLAGALIPNEVLLRAGRSEIERAISDSAIERHVGAAPGGPLPFQAVFFGDIGAVTSFELAAATAN